MTNRSATETDWGQSAPPKAVLAAVDAVGLAAAGDVDGCGVRLADCDEHPRWLVNVLVDTLAVLSRPFVGQGIWHELRAQLHGHAVDADAPDWHLRAALHALALAEARERGADLRVAELEGAPECSDFDLACVAAQLAGQVAASVWGDGLADRLQAARKLFGNVL